MEKFLLEERVLSSLLEGAGERRGTPADGLGASAVDLRDSGLVERKQGKKREGSAFELKRLEDR